VKVERYQPTLHYQTLVEWVGERGFGLLSPEHLPKTGLVAPGAAAGFIYATDSKMAIMEGLITNPGISLEARGAGLDAVVLGLLEEAWAQGFTGVMGFTKIRAVVERAARLGFETHPDDPYYLCVKSRPGTG